MNSNSLFKKVSNRFEHLEKFPLLVAMLEECCDHAENSDVPDVHKEASALIALQASLSMLRGAIKAGLSNADIITLNYRGQSFRLTPESSFVKEFLR